ncbi:Transcription factor MYB39 [Triticum urartu]|uniref:Transcription factor MYB39 n=1 Tax=Triticum urartu TaxID=4572 RepID=M8B4F1_TRIUA|nr:Transcription factor MYB39 [Triticum urartu]
MGRSPSCDGETGVKKGPWTIEEDKLLGERRWLMSWLTRWSSIATKLPGRTDNEIKNYWNTHLHKKLLGMGIDPVTHRPRTDLSLLAGLPGLLAVAGNFVDSGAATAAWNMNALKLQVDAAKFQLLQGLVRALTTAAAPAPAPGMDNLRALLAVSTGGIDQNMLLQQCQWNDMNNLPALTSSAPTSGMHNISGMFDGFSASDGLSSTELGCHGGVSGRNGTVDPMVADDQECKNNGGGGVSCEETPASSPFDGLQSLNLIDDLNTDGGWKDLLEQMSWLNSSEL